MNYNSLIKQNSIEINRIKQQIERTFNVKNKKDEWSNACDEYHKNYAKLCFWNGIYDYRSEIRNGNQETIEYYICFIEIRPYHFRSGYMYNDLMRVFKNIDLSTDHKRRYEIVRKNYMLYKEKRKNQNQG